jgi:hypothetical protein
MVFSRDYSLDHNIFNLLPYGFFIDTHLPHDFFKSRMTPFVPFAVVYFFFENCVLFVNAVVGQVHELVLDSTPSASLSSLIVLASCETSKTLLEDVDSQRLNTRDGHVHSQVELVSIYQ